MLGGYHSKLLHINLTNRTQTIETVAEATYRTYLGGSGLAARILYDRTNQQTNPLGPENLLIYMTGPFVGTTVPFSGRHHVTAKSPLTGIFGEADVGGRWGVSLKKAGFDGIVLRGRASTPVYIFINNRDVAILDATELWGLDTLATTERLQQKHGARCQVSCIGPAGENQVSLAGIVHDGEHARIAARTGLGAVMGSKNLKAIVVHGTQEVPIVDKEALKTTNKELLPKYQDNTKALSILGTAVGMNGAAATGDLPVKNWKLGGWQEQAQKISGERMAETILKKRYFCGACPTGCGRAIEITSGTYAGVHGAGPEYETLGIFGGNCMIDDLEAIAYANQLCNRLGLDTISTGNVVAFAMELYEHKLLTRKDTDGVELTWGNANALIAMIEKIAAKEGIGVLLGQGVKRAADQIGGLAHEFAMHVKGLDFPAHDPRAYNSMAVGYATSNRGACHLQGASYMFEKTATLPECGYPEPQNRLEVEGKGKLNFYTQNLMCILDSIKICKFGMYAQFWPTDIVRFVHDVIGWNMSVTELLEIGERIFNLKRMYNVRCGISRKDDTLPPRLLTQPRRDKGTGDNVPPLGKMLNEYYQIRGWSDEGIPTSETLSRLGLKW